jgi:hypothetical protein
MMRDDEPLLRHQLHGSCKLSRAVYIKGRFNLITYYPIYLITGLINLITNRWIWVQMVSTVLVTINLPLGPLVAAVRWTSDSVSARPR